MFLRPITPNSVVQRDDTARAALDGKTKPETTLIAAKNAIILNRFIVSLRRLRYSASWCRIHRSGAVASAVSYNDVCDANTESDLA
jgi:hypothetical protein